MPLWIRDSVRIRFKYLLDMYLRIDFLCGKLIQNSIVTPTLSISAGMGGASFSMLMVPEAICDP